MAEFEMIMKAALQALERGETVALASVIQVRGSAPRHAGACRIVPSRWLGVDAGRSDAPAYILARTLSQRVAGDVGGEVRAVAGNIESYRKVPKDKR